MLKDLVKKFKVARGNERREVAWALVREAARFSTREPYWEFLRSEFGVNPNHIKDAMIFLEEIGELEIKRSADGRRLWVMTLRDIKRNPVKLDRWLLISKRPPTK
ncbi:hypothetical protein [Thermococcus stetteri]|uniref:hypothetical protein n=1 Tax=Thermococcus stetteri TaxID=49900 RepID=UPI001AE183BB|nr:hypothetical protein [Thermococcus stetteri]MBP1911003.1 hypothetical protein [Thermococcus stetteri]